MFKYLLLSLCFIPSISLASSHICKLEDSLTGIKAIAWNDETGSAKITDFANNSYEGKVVLSRKHTAVGNKVNIYIPYNNKSYGAAEYVVFPVGHAFRVIGVTYVIKGNNKYLNTSEGNFEATCLSM